MPTVSSMPFLKPHFHSNGASAAVAYKLYSYDSTTEDALPLYKDPAGSVEYPNPLVLNARGEPDGMGLYLDNEKTYKLILKTAEDVEVWTVNAVQGVTGGGSTSVVTLPAHTAYANSGDSANVAAPVEIVSSITAETNDDLIASVGSVKEQVTNLQSDINTLSENMTCRVDGTPDQIVSTESVDEESGFKVFTESLSPTFVTRVTNIESSLLTKESLQYTGFRINSGSGPYFVKIASASFQSGYGSMDLTCGVGGSSTAYGEFSVKVIRAINGTSMYAQWNSLFNRASTFQLEEIRCFYVGPNEIQLWAKTASPFTQSSLSFEPLINVRYGSSGVAIGRAFSFQKVGTTGSYPSTYVNYCLAKSVDCLSASDQRRTEVTSDDASVEVTKTEVYDGKGYTNTFDLSALSTSPALSFVDIDSTDSPYSAPETIDEIVVSTATADVVVTLPVTSLKRFYIKWLLGTHNLTVNVADSGMIDGVTSFVFNTKFSVGTSISFVCKESGDWIANEINKINESDLVHKSSDETITGGKAFAKGAIFYGQNAALPTNIGDYIAAYKSAAYGCRILGYNGAAYKDLCMGAMPEVGKFSANFKATGDFHLGYKLNLGKYTVHPTTALQGDVYYNVTDNLIYYYNGTTWVAFGSGGGSSEIGYVASGDSLGAVATIALQAGSTSQWSAHAVMCTATGKLTPAVGTSLFGFIVPQTIVGGHFIGAIYKVEDSGTHTKICSTEITEFPATAQWTHSLISSLVTDKFIAPTERIYLTVMTDCNGVAVAGANAGSNLNLPPYIAAIKTNMGILTEAPATIQFESETNTRPFIYMTK